MLITPAILTNDIEEFENLLARISQAKKFDRVQIDFIDGEYANNQTVLPKDVKNPYELKLDAHLMVVEKNLQEYLRNLRLFDRIIVQMESIANPENFGCLALDIHSPIEAIEPYLPKLKLLNLMSIEPGFGGQDFDNHVLPKIIKLRTLGNYQIAIDGGIEKKHLESLEKAGADEVVVGAARVLEW